MLNTLGNKENVKLLVN